MTSISSTTNTPFFPRPISKEEIEPYSGGEGGSPNCWSWITAPVDFVKGSLALAKAQSIGDLEGTIDASILLAGTPISFLGGSFSFLTQIFQIGSFVKSNLGVGFKGSLGFLTAPIGGLGIVLCSLEAVYEAIGLSRSISFFREYNTPPENLIESLESFFSTYLSITDKEHLSLESLAKKTNKDLKELTYSFLQVKKSNLARRIGTSAVIELEKAVPKALDLLKSEDPTFRLEGEVQAEEIFETLAIQARKMLLIRIIAILSLVLSIIGLIFTFLPFSPLIPIILLGLGTLLSITKSLLTNGLLEEKGWKFSLVKCIPEWLRNCAGKVEKTVKRCFEKEPPAPTLELLGLKA